MKPTKNITAGEGGIIVTSDERVLQESRLLRNHGISGEYEHSSLGYNFRMTNIAAAIGIAQMKKLDTFNEKRRANARHFNEHLKDAEGITLPGIPGDEYYHVYNQYTIQVHSGRQKLMHALKEKGIGHKIFYNRTRSQRCY